MPTTILFLATVLIWGTTWVAIAAQLGLAPVVVSIFDRFALAGVVMLAGLALTGRLKRPAVWRFVFVQAACLFCCNFVGPYSATALIPSGLVSVIFSLASIFNALNARLFFGEPISRQTLLAGALGATGVGLLRWHDLAVALNPETLRGIGWAALGTAFFSWRNMASRANTARGVTPVIANGWGMGIGAAFLLAIVTATGAPQSLPTTPGYWAALACLSVIGSIAGFTAYLMLVARIGSARAGYAAVLFPIVALTASTLFGGYHWTPVSVLGAGLALLRNVVMFRRP